jgi:signal transduction histidine kinase/DNA-binding response OmpR family regulator
VTALLDSPGARVLVADANPDMRAFLVEVLGAHWSVVAVATAEEAVSSARRRRPELIVSDVPLPLADEARLRDVPLLLMVAPTDEAPADADEILVKPFSGRELTGRVSTQLELARLRRSVGSGRASLRTFMRQAPVAMSLVSGPELVFEEVNPLYERMVGRPVPLGKRFREVFPESPDDSPVLRMLENVLRTGESFTADEYAVALDLRGTGQLDDSTFKCTCQPIQLDGDEPSILTVAVDVTEQVKARLAVEAARKQLAEQHRSSETLHRIGRVLSAELDLDPILQILTDEATRLCRAQFGAYFYNVVDARGEEYMLYALSGVPREAFARFPMPRNTDVFGPTFRGETIVRSDDITKDPRYGHLPPYHGMPEGHLPVHSYLAVPVVNRNGKVLGGLFFGHREVGVFHEGDERLIAAVATQAAVAIDNAELYAQARAAESRTARLQAITADLSRAVTPAEAMHALLEATRPILDAAGAVAFLVVDEGRSLEVYAQEGPVDPGLDAMRPLSITLDIPICEAAREGKIVWEGTAQTILAKHPELADLRERLGAEAWGAVPLAFEGQTIGVAGFHCTSERTLSRADQEVLLAAGSLCAQAIVRARLYEAAGAARQAAEEASGAKDDFLAMLGHELRNPLAPIQTALQLARLRNETALLRERTVIERQVEHLERLVDDLLDVSRIRRGKIELKRAPLELGEVVFKAIEMASPLIERHRHQLAVEVPRSGLRVSGDPIRLAQVVANLLTNAAKYTADRGELAISAGRQGGIAEVRVRDNGIGIAPEILPRIFEVFVQERQSLERSQGGLGLGLTIVRSLVALHGGTVEARSAGRGRGSEFIVRLPALGVEPRPPAHAPLEPARRQHALRVLVVDDNRDAADLLAESLGELGHITKSAYDGVAALRLASDFAPQVALLDIGLPVMDGYELATKLRAAHPEIRLVAITGYGQESDRRRSAEAGFHVHLVKPIRLQAVIAALDQPG